MILALNGGGMRGALQVGALLEFPSEDLCKTFCDGVYGISVGSIIATYIAFGFSAHDICEIFAEWVDVPLAPLTILSLKNAYSETHGGLDDGSIIRERMRQNFAKRKGLDFDSLRIADAHIPLHIIATDVERVQSGAYLSTGTGSSLLGFCFFFYGWCKCCFCFTRSRGY